MLSNPLSIAVSIVFSINYTSIISTFFIKIIESSIPISIIATVNKYITVLFDVEFTTMLHIKEAMSTAETIVVEMDFLINPIPTAIIPIVAAISHSTNLR